MFMLIMSQKRIEYYILAEKLSYSIFTSLFKFRKISGIQQSV